MTDVMKLLTLLLLPLWSRAWARMHLTNNDRGIYFDSRTNNRHRNNFYHYYGEESDNRLDDRFRVTILPSGHLHVDVGRQAIMQCRAEGAESARIQWSKVGGVLPPRASNRRNSYLVIDKVEPDDGGTYLCTATTTISKEAVVELHINGMSRNGGHSKRFRDDALQPLEGSAGSFRCGPNEATCRNGECIKREELCDGDFDCRDRSDELYCGRGSGDSKICEPNEFRCDNGRCVQKMWVCDSEDDCGDRSDERNCGSKGPGDACAPWEFKCQTRGQCIPRSYHCDGQNDCQDGSDEIGCVPPTVVEPPAREIRVCHGETIVINCRATGGPVPHISWRLNWGPVCDPPRCVQTSVNGYGTFTIRDSTEQDQGAYSCEAINVKGRVLATPDAIVTVSSCRPEPQFNCHTDGTLERDQNTCRCKTYATGPTCGQCADNTFYLAPGNPHGCIPCFCTGVTKACQSSSYYRTQERLSFPYDNSGVQLVDVDGQRMGQLANDVTRIRGYLTADAGQPGETLYWKLPDRFIGNKLTAYGGKLKFLLQYTGEGPLTNEPLVVLKGHEITIIHQGPRKLNSREPIEIVIDMYETSWNRDDGQDVTREHLLMTLAKIDLFLIRASHCHGQTSTSLGDVVLDVAVPTDTQQIQALAVEQCHCPPGYKGLSCEECADGYERSGGGLYLGTCVPSSAPQCNVDGSISPSPDSSGRCQCKEHATGPKCDQCKPQTFYLSSNNPFGCIPCFCSGVTRDCDSSNYYRSTIRSSFDESTPNELSLRTNEASGFYTSRVKPILDGQRQLSVIDFSDVPQGKPLYMELPRQFLGNKITSYGGTIKLTVKCTGDGQQDKYSFLIIRGNDINLLYKPQLSVQSGVDSTLTAQLFENNWIRDDGLMSTREHLLMTLADLNTILVKITCFERTNHFTLVDVAMDIAEPHQVSRERAFAVEQCRCPPGYVGTSCEDCAAGHTRTGGGLYLGLCEPCQCHGHADMCDPEFGDCINCQHNTHGPRCEFCTPPYSGDATRGRPDDCRPQAERCTDCQRYNHCPRGCDVDCRCIQCEHNTEGPDCGQCKPGYYGDARRGTPHDCQPCPCPGGGECYLDNTGRPVCRQCPPGYAGPDCRQCAEGYAADPYDLGRCKPIGPLNVRVDPERQNVEEGASTSFRCTSDNPEARLSWYGPNNNLPAGSYERSGELLLYNLSPAHSGTYKCLALFPNGQTATAYGSLNVTPRAEEPFAVRIREPKYPRVEEGQPLTMYCEVVGRPSEPVRLVWSKVGSPSLPQHASESQGVLNFYDLRSDDSGHYQCVGTTPSGQSAQDDATLVVQPRYAPPVHVEPFRVRILEPKQVEVDEGGTARFTCEAVGRYPEEPQLSWTRPGRGSLPAEAQVDRGRLTIYNVGQQDAGPYTCIGSIPGQEAQDEAIVLVKPKPEIPFKVRIREPKEKHAREGSSVGFYCEVIGQYPERYELVWSRANGSPLPATSTSRDGQLNLFDITADTSGKYVCTGTTVDGLSSSDEANLMAEPAGLAPMPSVTPKVQTVRPGDPVEIICTSGGDPPPIIQWGFGGAANPLRQGIDQEDGRLRIPAAELTDAGDYYCTASNIHDTLSEMASVYVESGPIRPTVHIEPTHDKKLEPGEDFEFVCTATGTQPIQLSWVEEQKGSISANMRDDGSGKLSIYGARPENEGRYVCIATNTAGEDRDTVQVSVGAGDLKVKIVPGGDEHGIIEVAHQDPLNLECVAEASPGLPKPRVEWIYDIGPSRGDVPDGYKPVETRGNFISHEAVTEHNEGKYTCRASSGNLTKEVSIQVNVLPRQKRDVIIIGASERSLAPGDNLVLSCVLSDPAASGALRWSRIDPDSGRSSAPSRGSSDERSGTLRVDGVVDDDAGIYECQHFDEDEGRVVASSRVTVVVHAPGAAGGAEKGGGGGEGAGGGPREVMVEGGAVQVAEMNEDFQLKCSAYAPDDVESDLKWFHQGKGSAETTARGRVRDGILSIPNVRARDAGLYTCAQYINGVRGGEYQVTLIVSYTEKDAVRKSIPVGGDTEIECPVHAVTGMSYAWVRLRDAIPEKFTTDRHLLRIHDFQPSDAGVYECEAWINDNNALGYVNMVPQELNHVQLFMEVNPDYVTLGNDVTFKCIVEGDDTATIRWEKGEGDLPPRSEVTGDSLTIFNVRKEDTGIYRCVATTTAGTMTTEAVLQIGSKILTNILRRYFRARRRYHL